MQTHRHTFPLLLFVVVFIESISSSSFPSDFLFAAATSSYQIEGAWNADGKGESIWDRLCHTHPELITNNGTGDVTCDSYHKYKEDVALMKEIGFHMYRFSISWSRILPNGDITRINEAGIVYYQNLLDELLRNKIQPMVTIYHYDLPQSLQNIGGWMNPLIVDYIADYADLLFQKFGDKVKWWITINAPFSVVSGYDYATLAPNLHLDSPANYIAAHNIVKAHAQIFRLYEKKYRSAQNGKISISLNGPYCFPKTNSSEDEQAADRAFQFFFGWFANPIYSTTGDYPEVMRKVIDANSKKEKRNRSRLPSFTPQEVLFIKGTFDFFALNHYTSLSCSPSSADATFFNSFYEDLQMQHSEDEKWPKSRSSWLKVVPEGMKQILIAIKNRYGDVPVFITENGVSDSGNLEDVERVSYHRDYLKEVEIAMKNHKCNVIGYTVWSLLDNFDWNDGYEAKFGLVQVNFSDPHRTRNRKKSSYFFEQLIKTRTISK